MTIWLVAAWLLATASPVPIVHLRQLTASSDLVVRGEVVSVADLGRASAFDGGREMVVRRKAAEVRVDEAIKGDAPRVLRCEFYEPVLPSSGYRGLARGQYLVIFLKRDRGRFVFTSPYHPFVVSVPGTPTDAAAQPFDRVIEGVAAVLRDQDAPEPVKRDAVYTLSDLNTPASIAALELMLTSPEPALRLNAVTGLLNANHLGALAIAEETLLGETRALPPHVLGNLRIAIARGITNEAAVPYLRRLAAAEDRETRRAAEDGLRRTEHWLRMR